MAILARITLGLASAAFVSGFLITALTASIRAVKVWLVIIMVIGLLLTIAALVLTNNAFVYLMFQFMTLVILFCFMVILGAACGYGVYLLIHSKPPGMNLDSQDMSEYLLLSEFCELSGVDSEKAMARIESGFYTGGYRKGEWFIHRKELGDPGTVPGDS